MASFPYAMQTLVPILLIHETTTDACVESKSLSTGIGTFDLVHHVLVPVVF